MTTEHRLDRAERVLMLIIKAGYRARQQSRAQDEKINILIDAQIKTDEQLKTLREGQAALQLSMQEGHSRMQESYSRMQEGYSRLQEGQVRLQEGQVRLQEGEVRLQEGHSRLQEGQSRLEKVMTELAEEHKATERSLKAFLDSLKGRNGGPST